MSDVYYQLIDDATDSYIAQLLPGQLPTDRIAADMLLEKTRTALDLANSVRANGDKFRMPQALYPAQIAKLVTALHPVRRIPNMIVTGNSEQDYTLVMYHTYGENEGIYATEDDGIWHIIKALNSLISDRDMRAVISDLKHTAPIVHPTTDPNLIPVKNGIYDYNNKTLLPFSPDLVFQWKSPVAYNPQAQNVHIPYPDDPNSTWDVETWIEDMMCNDPEMVELIWQSIGAVLRPYVRFDKALFFFSRVGRNGKGSICRLMSNLLPAHVIGHTKFESFGNSFQTESLLGKIVNISDENANGSFASDLSDFKAMVTHDPIDVNRKNSKHVTFTFNGVFYFCFNDLIRAKDRSDALYQRMILVPFQKTYRGKERPYIQTDYLKRQEVLEYVLFKVLHMSFDRFIEPAACKALLSEYQIANNPIKQFFEEIVMERCAWDFLPYKFLWSLYVAYYKTINPSGRVEGKCSFTEEIRRMAQESGEWEVRLDKKGKPANVRVGNMMQRPEFMIIEYQVKDYMNPNYTGSDPEQICRPIMREIDRGLIRIHPLSDDTPPTQTA